MKERITKMEYCGLLTQRFAFSTPDPLLTASVRQNKIEANNNGWQHDKVEDEFFYESNNFDLTWE